MTEFIESFTTRHMLPPWHTKAARSWMFVAPMSRQRIQVYLDAFLNAPGPDSSPFWYKPWTDPCFGFLTLVNHKDFRGRHSTEASTRKLEHKEFMWSFPAARYRRTADDALYDKTLVWIQPFYFDTNSFVTFSSREIWGGEKGMADIVIASESSAQDFHMDVELNGFATYNPRSHVHAIGGVHIRGGPLASGPDYHGEPDGPPWPTSRDGPEIKPLAELIKGDKELLSFIASFQGLMHNEWKPEDPTHHFFVPELRINSLKQYRDAFSVERAAYRSIVECKVTHDTVTDYGYLPGERVDIRFMWSDSFKEQLMLLLDLAEPDEDAPRGHPGHGMHIPDTDIDWNLKAVKLDVRLALHFRSNAAFHVEKVLYTYGQGAEYTAADDPDGDAPD